MNPLSKIIRSRKTAKGKTQQQVEQQPAQEPRPLDESELKLVGGGGGGSTTSTVASESGGGKVDSPRGTW